MRRPFPAKVMLAAYERAKEHCQECGCPLRPGKFHYDHIIADALGGEPTLENCAVVCTSCHGVKTRTKDQPAIAKVKRVAAKHIGIRKPSTWNQKYKRKVSGETVLR